MGEALLLWVPAAQNRVPMTVPTPWFERSVSPMRFYESVTPAPLHWRGLVPQGLGSDRARSPEVTAEFWILSPVFLLYL